MRTIDRSTFRNAGGQISFSTRLQAVFKEGLGWQAEVQAQEDITRRLAKVFGDDYVLVRNCPMPTSHEPVPLILIGPIGVRVMMTTSLRGTYRAKAGQWMSLGGSGTFKSSHPNLASRLRLFEDAVRRFVTSKGINLPEGEPVLIVARPETYVENIKTSLRVVLADGVENFATSLMQLRPILSPAVVEDITRALGGPKDEAPIEAEAVQAAVAVLPRSSAPTVPAALVAAADPDSREMPASPAGPAERRRRLTRKQAVLLVLLGLANLCVLGALVVVVVTNSLVGS
ncbi:MAG TPA: hypothetical protein VJJ70_00575 [Anaerolineales bacterium]|nr:hypothetical protein [Anaerolineales bacterium]